MCKRFIASLLVALLMLGGYGLKNVSAATLYDDGELVISDTAVYPKTDEGLTCGKSGNEFSDGHFTQITIGGDTITGASQISTPMEDQGTYVRIAGDDDVQLYDNGNVVITGDMDADSYIMENDAQLDNASNNAVTLTENSDVLTLSFTGDDVSLDMSDGGIIFALTDATDGTFDVYCNNVSTDYLSFSQGTNQSTITATGTGNDLYLAAAGGDINLADENVTGTGTISMGNATFTAIAGVDTITGSTNSDVVSLATDDVLSFQSDDGVSTIEVIGYSGYDARLAISADDNEDSGDTYFLTVDNASDNLTLYNETTALVVFDASGNVDVQTGILTMANDETIANSTDDTVRIASNDSSVILDVYSPNTSDGTAAVRLISDADGDAGDGWQVQASGSETMIISNDTSVAGTYVTKLTIAGTDGDITTTGDIEIVDDMDLVLGTNSDWKVQYDEAVDDQLLFITANTACTATTDPMVEFLVGATPTANQEVFGVGKGTQASNTALLTVDAEGDTVITGDVTVTGSDLTVGAAGVKLTGDGDGALTLLGLGNGSDEDLTINLDDTADTVTISSSTSVGTVVFTGMALDYDQAKLSAAAPIINMYDTDATAGDVNAAIACNATDTGDGTEDIDVTLAQQIAGTARTVATFDADGNITLGYGTQNVVATADVTVTGSDLTLGTAGVKLTGDGDGAITLLGLGDGSDEDLTINLDDTSDQVSISSSTGVATVDFGTINLATDALDVSDGDITNVGDIACDSLTADGTTIVVTAGDHVTMGSATADCGVLTMIAGAQASDPTLTITQGANLAIAETVGDITMTAADDIFMVPTGDVVQIGTTNDDTQPNFQILADADSDAGGDTAETLTITLTPNADPTAATWAFTNTQCAGYTFDDHITTSTGTVSAEHLVSTDDADINDNLTVGDIIVDEAAGVINFSGATSASILSDSDALTIGGVNGAANNENLVFDFETVADTVGVSSGTSAATVDFGTINLATDAVDVSDGNITNVGDIACDSITSDASTVVLINDGLQGLVDEITATDAGVAASLTTVVTEITSNGDQDLDMVTLANGVSGQIKVFVWAVEGHDGDTMKITPSTMLGGSQITFGGGATDVGDGCVMIYLDNEGWAVVGNNGGTIS